MQSMPIESIPDSIKHWYINVHNFAEYLDDSPTNYYIVLHSNQENDDFFEKRRFLPNTVKVALIIKLLQKFSFGINEKIWGKIWFSSAWIYSDPAPINWMIDSWICQDWFCSTDMNKQLANTTKQHQLIQFGF